MSFKKNLAAISIAATAFVIGVPMVALAAIPDSSGNIHSCYTNGLVPTFRIINSSSQSCNGLETGLNWSQTGLAAHLVTGDSDTVATDSGGLITDPHTDNLDVSCGANEYALQGYLVVTTGLGEALFGVTGKGGTAVGSSNWVDSSGTGYTIGTDVDYPSGSGTVTIKVICLPVPGLPS